MRGGLGVFIITFALCATGPASADSGDNCPKVLRADHALLALPKLQARRAAALEELAAAREALRLVESRYRQGRWLQEPRARVKAAEEAHAALLRDAARWLAPTMEVLALTPPGQLLRFETRDGRVLIASVRGVGLDETSGEPTVELGIMSPHGATATRLSLLDLKVTCLRGLLTPAGRSWD